MSGELNKKIWVALAALFILAFIAILAAVLVFAPSLSNFSLQPQFKVLVVGHASPAMETVLKSEDYRLAGVNYAGSFQQEAIVSGVLKNFDVVILQGEQACDAPARKEIGDRVRSGGKLIVIGDACTLDASGSSEAGWDVGIGTLGDVIPVEYDGFVQKEGVGAASVFADGKFRIVQPYHPIFEGIIHYDFYGTLASVRPTANSDVLAYVDTYGGKITAPATFAIVESKGFLSGKTIYFAFDPSNMDIPSRNLFLNALLYVRDTDH